MKNTINYQDFEKLDLRVGRVLEASNPDWSEKLLEFKVDFGEELGIKTILSGIKKFYEPEDFVNNFYIFVVNLEERKMGEGVSQGMMLMADPTSLKLRGASEKPVPIKISEEVAPGAVIR